MRHTKLTVASHVPAATHPRRSHQVSLRTCTTHRAQRVQRGSTQTATPTRTALAAPTAKSSLPLCRRRALPATRTFLTLVDQRSARRAARGRCSRRQGRLCAWCAQRVALTTGARRVLSALAVVCSLSWSRRRAQPVMRVRLTMGARCVQLVLRGLCSQGQGRRRAQNVLLVATTT